MIKYNNNAKKKNNYAKYEDLLCSAVILILQHIFIENLSTQEVESSFIEKLNDYYDCGDIIGVCIDLDEDFSIEYFF